MDILKEVEENEEFLIAQRRYFHAHPEVSGKEYKTIEKLDEILTAEGIEHVVVPNGGILGFIRGEKAGKTVLLRADVDALPLMESPNNLKGPKVCVSENPGVCQACGHDGHTAMLLTAARVLNRHKEEMEGTVICMFERGEEFAGNVIHLYRYMQQNKLHIDSAYGTHLYAMLESGKISLRDGPVMAGAMGFNITIKGSGGHGSRPDQAVSPIDCFVAVYEGMNALRMRKISPFHSLTFSVGMLSAGAASNIIPDELTFGGTVRMFELEDGLQFKKELLRLLDGICPAYGCTYLLNSLSGPIIAVKNDAECAALARKAVGSAIGQQHMQEAEPWMASESMAVTLAMWPGVFALLGIENPEKGTGAPHHNSAFDLDEEVLKYGAAAAAAYAIAFLKEGPDVSGRAFKGEISDLYAFIGRPPEEVAYIAGEGAL